LTSSLASRQFISRRSYYNYNKCSSCNEDRKKLDELESIVFTDRVYDFVKLKNEIARLKIKELAPQLQNQKEQIEKLTIDSKKQLSEESKTVLNFYLATLKKEEDEDDHYGSKAKVKAGKLAA